MANWTTLAYRPLEIDAHWEYLAGALRTRSRKEEQIHQSRRPHLRPSRPRRVDIPNYYGSIDMVHSLHCLNTIRQQFDPEYYERTSKVPKHAHRMKMRMHVDHCIYQLRQAILCHADLTPVSLRPVLLDDPSADLVSEMECEHTCRNWKVVREWLTRRGEKEEVLPPKGGMVIIMVARGKVTLGRSCELRICLWGFEVGE
ncbi:hypothetical protein K458DRAFT_403946 [Lentithecium fluviatile CBS 122367]|uniref:Uncharacterized protein n=1 Tax=Lentithecium fluviatile CBS 122367 TaxID=1168545 RepID=A0A6G1J1K7_9PLEO|nr:hypothetical protein K458DRAFT_403946 [Lentithecium fluviatile CBS 122367]